MNISRLKLSSTLALVASTFALLSAGCSKSSDADDSTTDAQETTTPGASTTAPPTTTNTSTTPTGTTQPSSTATNTTTATNTGNPTPTMTAEPDPTTEPSPTSTETQPPDGVGGMGNDETTSDPTDDTATEDPTGDETTDETDTGEDTETSTGETTDEGTDETTNEPDPTSEPPEVGECSSVITGELSECAVTSEADPNFSFFVASRLSMVALSGNPLGFGGNLGGLECADTICALIAECVAPANGKTWHAFLSTSEVDAKDRIGSGPWHDVVGTKIADDLSGLIGVDRPTTADGVVNHNLPNEFGCENLTPACDDVKEDNHHTMTGSNKEGTYVEGHTCNDWTSSDATPGTGPAVGLAWERSLLFGGGGGGGGGGGAVHWLNFENESGCGPGGNLDNNPPMGNNDGSVGSGGGYGAIYCFAVTE